jgi:DNA-binding response OmpR family regulator
MHILITEDEPLLARFIARGLHAAGYDTSIAVDGVDALEQIEAHEWDLVVLDLLLPGLDGFDVLAAVAERQRPPRVLVLSARQEVATRVAALDGGASDFLAKPFSFDELLARVRAQTRDGPVRPRPAARFPSLHLDDATREVSLGEDRRGVRLSAREYDVLAYLVRTPEVVVSRERLLNAIWKYQFDPRSNVVDVSVGRLRRRLDGMLEIDAVRGGGYRVRLARGARDGEGDGRAHAGDAANRSAAAVGASDGVDDRQP